MKLFKLISSVALVSAAVTVFAAPVTDFNEQAKKMLTDHYNKYKDMEYFSGIAMAISIPGQPIKNFYIGNVARDAKSAPIDNKSLFQIGSITKSFTAAVILQLEQEGKLKISDNISKWLPEYAKWGSVTIEQMLNMSSGLPNYSDTPLWNTQESEQPARFWQTKDLINFVYPQKDLSPPLKTGYFYTNTGYVLVDMMIEKITKQNFNDELVKRTITKAKLANTFYPVPAMTADVTARMVHGYNYNQYDNPPLVGKDLANNNLSWAGAAGAVVSNAEDIIRWVKALLIDKTILAAQQQNELTRMISMTTHEPITVTSAADPRGFGLGVAQIYDPKIGNAWFYEGKTLGYRAIYIYSVCNGVIISTIFNSATNEENDHAKELMESVYKLVIDQDAKLQCVKNS